MRFLHTADWQIGKPFQSIADPGKRESLRQKRIETIRGLKSLIDERQLQFVVVCGDLFDSFTPDKATVSALCSAVGTLEVPVYAIPGNHDHGGPGCIWQQAFFLREQEQLAPNLKVLLEAEPVLLEDAVLLPCPLLRRHESSDPTAWLRNLPEGLPEGKSRIVMAHGSTQGFSSSGDSDETAGINQIDLGQLPAAAYDYCALGDWHGCKEIAAATWYSGTPEQDRFAKGDSNQPGKVLVVEIQGRGQAPSVQSVATGRVGWHVLEDWALHKDADLQTLSSELDALFARRTGEDLCKLSVQGTLSLAGQQQLDELIESLRARLIDLRLEQNLQLEPSAEELAALTQRQDPLIARVAQELSESLDSEELAREALRELQLEIGKVSA
ncbi:MAG: DNA repair exonuclease [Opitutales bacterium]|nr:DNA repair exonuclease [Opitutales bacterium]